MLIYVKAFLDVIIKALDYFPGWKMKVGAVIQVLATLMMVYNNYLSTVTGFIIPPDIVIAVQAAGATLTAVGVAAPATRTP